MIINIKHNSLQRNLVLLLAIAFLAIDQPLLSADEADSDQKPIALDSTDRIGDNGWHAVGVGDRAPDFTLPSLDGKEVSLSSCDDGAAVLWFTNLCSGCQSVLSEMESISSYSGGGISVIAVSLLGNDTTTARDIAEKYDISFPILIDPTAEVYEKYGGAKLPPGTCPVNPQFFVVNHGRVTYATHFPSAPIDEIRAAVDKATALPKPGDSTGSGYKYQKNQPDDPQDSTDH